jgi:hypothetical protein
MTKQTDFARAMEIVARDLLGEPSVKTGNEWRYGTKHSLAVDLKDGTWFDHENKIGGGVLGLIKRAKGLDGSDARQYLRELGCDVRDEPKPKGKRERAAFYDYHDQHGNVVFRVERWVYRLPDGSLELTKDGGKVKKAFTQRRADGKGGWIKGKGCMKGVRWVPYRLPDLVEAIAEGKFIVSIEGEKKVDLLWKWGIPATCNAGGSKNWQSELAAFFEGADIICMPDNDKAGADHVETVGAALYGIASSIRVLKLPNLPPKGDVMDWADAGGTAEELHRLIETAATPWAAAPGTLVDDGRPLIEIAGGALMANLAKIEAAIIADDAHAPLFQRGGALVRLVRDHEHNGRSDISRAANALMIHVVTAPYLLTRMAEAARFAKGDGRSGSLTAKDPPTEYATALMSRVGHWTFKPLLAVVEAPTLRPETWSVLQKPGYDEQSGLYFEPGAEAFSPLDEHPTRADASKALETLREPFAEFPFVDEAARSVALAAVLTALVRRSLPAAPMFLFDAPIRASGKTLITRAIGHIATGHETANATFTGDQTEERKRILSLLMTADPIVNFDNINGPFEGDTLCAVLTAPFFQDRRLGASQMISVPTCTVWLGTGNNIVVRGDLATRVLPCRIDPKVERPETRTFKRDLMAYLAERRAVLVGAALTMMRAYVVAGRPKQPISPFGRFEEWSGLVRSTLLWLGCADPCEPQESLLRDDPGAQDTAAVLAALGELYPPPLKFKASQVVEACNGAIQSINLGSALKTALPRGEITARALGYWLRSHKDRIVNGMCVRQYRNEAGREKVAEWFVVDDEHAGDEGYAGYF